MFIRLFISVIITVVFTFFSPPVVSAIENVEQYCYNLYSLQGQCPEDVCRLGCYGGLDYEGCELECEPRPCVEINVAQCPEDACQVIKGCSGEDVCYYRTDTPKECGELAYSGEKDCCREFVKRCGAEYFDGSCEMLGEYSIYSVPICIPCGNGVCNQFENRCNCPEDCDSTGTSQYQMPPVEGEEDHESSKTISPTNIPRSDP